MKIVFCLSVFLTFAFGNHSVSFAQELEKQPEFPGGEEAMMMFIRDNVEYPEDAVIMGDKGCVYIEFVVEIDGSISKISVLKGVTPSLDKEAMRVISLMPNWTPGMADGKLVRVRYTVPIHFKFETRKMRKEKRKELK